MGRPPKIHRDQVLDAARAAFVERGFEGTTLADISSRLGVSPAALLRHAPTKGALFTAAMGATPDAGNLPLAFLQDVPGEADPAQTLRQVAHAFVPFIQAKLRENLARWVHFRTVPGVGSRRRGAPVPMPPDRMRGRRDRSEAFNMPLPFDPGIRPTPPQRNFRLLE